MGFGGRRSTGYRAGFGNDRSEFAKEISCFDIVCLSEIKCNMDTVSFEGYRSHVLQRKRTKKGHVHGGLAIVVKNQLWQGVKYLQSTLSEY